MQIFSSQEKKRELLAVGAFLFLAAMLSYGHLESLIPSISDPREIQAFAQAIGPYGPAAIIALQFAQVLIAPLPPLTPVVSGMLYGVTEGVFYSVIGAGIGSALAILISRKYGRSFVEDFLSDEAMDKFDKFTTGHGYLPFIVLFTFPGFPDDALCFIAGLTKLDWKHLAVLATVGRIPGMALLALTGSSIAEANTSLMLAGSTGIVAISFLSVKYERQLEHLAENIEQEGLQIYSWLNGLNPFYG